MALDKPLTIRNYLEPRFAAAAGSRLAEAARRNAGNFQDLLKSEAPKPADGSVAGMKIADYFKNPVATARAAASNSAGPSPPAADTRARGGAQAPRSAQPAPSERPLRAPSGAAGRIFSNASLPGVSGEAASRAAIKLAVQEAAAQYNLSPELIQAVIRAESNFQPQAVSHAGAMGLMQLMPETARELGVTRPFDIRQNIDGGARYLRQMLDRFGGDVNRALAAYNAGPGAVEQFKGVVPYAETRQYVQRVMRYAGLVG